MTNGTFPANCSLVESFILLLWHHEHCWHFVSSYITLLYLKRNGVCFFLITFSSRLNTVCRYITVELKGRRINCSTSTILYLWQDRSQWLFPSSHKKQSHLQCASLLIQVDGGSKSLKLYTYQNGVILTTNFTKEFPVSFLLLTGEEYIDVWHLIFKWYHQQIILDLGWYL